MFKVKVYVCIRFKYAVCYKRFATQPCWRNTQNTRYHVYIVVSFLRTTLHLNQWKWWRSSIKGEFRSWWQHSTGKCLR